jgi:hypothetical protein
MTVPVHVMISNCGDETVNLNGAPPIIPQIFEKSKFSSMGSVRFSPVLPELGVNNIF